MTRSTFKMKKKFGDLIIGIDAVAEEDRWVQSLDLANVFMQKAEL